MQKALKKNSQFQVNLSGHKQKLFSGILRQLVTTHVDNWSYLTVKGLSPNFISNIKQN